MRTMKKLFSTAWVGSAQRRKQRKYRHNAPLHTQQKFMGSALSKDLRKKHGRRSIAVRRGDKVKVVRGNHKGKITTVERVNLRACRVYLKDIEVTRKDGRKANVGIHPSNLIIQELNLEDKQRVNRTQKSEKA